MTDEERERCLEPFFSTKGDRGTGLGLAVVYGIIHRHGGDHRYPERKAPRARPFSLRFPASTLDVTSAPVQTAEIERALRILVVDDQEIICELIAEYLQCDGHEAVACQDPRKAIDLFADGHFDLVITDQSMPGINGVQLANSHQDHHARSAGDPAHRLWRRDAGRAAPSRSEWIWCSASRSPRRTCAMRSIAR